MPIPKNIEGIHLTGSFPTLSSSQGNFKKNLSFSRGFLLIKRTSYEENERSLNDRFDSDALQISHSHTLLVHKRLRIQSHQLGGIKVYILGLAVTTTDISPEAEQDLARYLCEKIKSSISDFYDALNFISGTYALIWEIDDEINILNDAHGLRSIFYSQRTGSCSSHLELLNMVEREGVSAIQSHSQKRNYIYCYQYPGNLTSYENLRFLTPNFSLRLNDVAVERFFPIEKRVFLSPQEIKKRLKKKFELLMRKYCSKGRVAMSLTGGRDSRVSFFSTSDLKDKIYYFSESRGNDLLAAKKIAKKHNLSWIGFDPRIVDNSENTTYDEFQNILKESVFPKSVTWALRAQFLIFNIFSADDYIHIHSNCAESGRGRAADYEFPFQKNEYSFDKYLDAYIKGAVAWLPAEKKINQYEEMKRDQFLIECLRKYFDELDHMSFSDLGYNSWDFMYIEHRSACFLSQIHVLNQVSFESTSLSNSRDILTDMWSMRDEYINKSSVLYNSILNEFDEDERNKTLGDGYEISSDTSVEQTELIYSGPYILRYLSSIGKWSECLNIINEIYQIDPEIPYIYEYCFNACFEMGDFSRLVGFTEYVASSQRLKSLIKYQWIESVCNKLRAQNNIELVIKISSLFSSLEKRNFWAFKQISHVFESVDKLEALAYIRKAYELNNQDQWVNIAYARILIDLNKTDELFELLNNLEDIEVKSAWHFHTIGRAYTKIRMFDKARRWIGAGLNIYPADQTLLGLKIE